MFEIIPVASLDVWGYLVAVLAGPKLSCQPSVQMLQLQVPL
jgi:hypothetical protein